MILAIFLLVFSSSASSCRSVFESSDYPISPTLRRDIEKLNPILLNASNNQKLYVTLRAEEGNWSDSNQVLSASLQRRILENYSAHFRISTDPNQIKKFYLESLNSLYSRAAWDFKIQEVEKIIDRSLPRDLLKPTQALMDSFFPYSSMAILGVSAQRSLEFFTSQPWLEYPWKEALQITEAWLIFSKGLSPAADFLGWYEKQTTLPRLTSSDLQRLAAALGKDPRPVDCCLSPAACFFCPSHRSIVIKK